MVQQRPLNAGMVAHIYAQSGPKGPLGQASQDTGGAELASGEALAAQPDRESPRFFGEAPRARSKISMQVRINRQIASR